MIRDTDDEPKTCKTCAETGRECHWTRAANVPHSEVNAAASTQRTSEMRDIEMVDVESIPSQSSRKRKRAPEGKGKGKSKADPSGFTTPQSVTPAGATTPSSLPDPEAELRAAILSALTMIRETSAKLDKANDVGTALRSKLRMMSPGAWRPSTDLRTDAEIDAACESYLAKAVGDANDDEYAGATGGEQSEPDEEYDSEA